VMNALALYHDLKARGVLLQADGGKLHVDAPTGELTNDDKAALVQFKPILLRFLAGREEPRNDGRHFKARLSSYPGYTSLYDPVSDEWHDFPTRDCLPSIVEQAKGERRTGRAS
jgi:TubC N-terminal docking domain